MQAKFYYCIIDLYHIIFCTTNSVTATFICTMSCSKMNDFLFMTKSDIVSQHLKLQGGGG